MYLSVNAPVCMYVTSTSTSRRSGGSRRQQQKQHHHDDSIRKLNCCNNMCALQSPRIPYLGQWHRPEKLPRPWNRRNSKARSGLGSLAFECSSGIRESHFSTWAFRYL